jgi:hypothetical protein
MLHRTANLCNTPDQTKNHGVVFVSPSASKCGPVSAAFPRTRGHASGRLLLRYQYPERS